MSNFLGHFGEEYPWHTKTLEELTARLDILSRSLEKPAKISLRNGFKYECIICKFNAYKFLSQNQLFQTCEVLLWGNFKSHRSQTS